MIRPNRTYLNWSSPSQKTTGGLPGGDDVSGKEKGHASDSLVKQYSDFFKTFKADYPRTIMSY